MDPSSLRSHYLDLLKKTLSFSLWEQPPYPIELDNPWRVPWKRRVVNALGRVLARYRLKLVSDKRFSPDEIREGKFWPLYGESMIGMKRLDNIQACVETILRDDVPGDLLEAGVWRGGATILMKGVLAAHGDTQRKVLLADSFAGLPPPDPDKYPADQGDIHSQFDQLAVSLEQVRANFEKYGLLDERVEFIKGWFAEALPKAALGPLSLIRIDGDMYASTMDAISNLYQHLAPGGFCIIDDYVFPPCRQAVEDYRQQHGITEPIEAIDWTGVFWRKRGA